MFIIKNVALDIPNFGKEMSNPPQGSNYGT
jgi:hypothetical protein